VLLWLYNLQLSLGEQFLFFLLKPFSTFRL
jgi:hypothetical protein